MSTRATLFELLNTTESATHTIDLFKKEYKYVDLISTNIIEEDIKYLEKASVKTISNAKSYWESIPRYIGSTILTLAKTMLQIENHKESNVLKYFKACDTTNYTTVQRMDDQDFSSCRGVTDIMNCSSLFDEVKMCYFTGHRIPSYQVYNIETGIREIFAYEGWYLSKVKSVYQNMSCILETLPEHQNHLNNIHFVENMTLDLINLYNILLNVSKVENMQEAIPVLNQLLDSYLSWKIMNEKFRAVSNQVSYSWLKKAASKEKPLIEATFDNFLKEKRKNRNRDESYEQFKKAISVDYHSSHLVALNFLSHINDYLERNITKLQLATYFNSLTLNKALNDISNAVTAKKQDDLTSLNNKVDLLKSNVSEVFTNLTNLTLPILNRINAHDLFFIKEAQGLDRMEFNNMIKSFDDDLQVNFINFLKMNYDGFLDATEKLLKNISVITNDFTEQVTRLQEDLSKYKISTHMDAEFYK